MTEDAGISIGITQVEYSNTRAGAVVHLFGRTKLGVPIKIDVKNFRPYFYVEKEDAKFIDVKKCVVDYDITYKTIHGIPVYRVYTKKPGDIKALREGTRHHEADVVYTERFLIDNNIKYGVSSPNLNTNYFDLKPISIEAPLRTCMIDIECNDERGFPKPERDEVICVTMWDSFDDRYITLVYQPNNFKNVHSCIPKTPHNNGCFNTTKHTIYVHKTEREMLLGIVAYIDSTNPDLITGWNTTGFDIPYITKRMEILGINPERLGRIPGKTSPEKIRGRVTFDLLTAYKKLQAKALESYRLDAVAKEEIGEEKVRFSGKVSDIWKNEPNKLIEYNFKDVELCIGINNKNKIVEFYHEIAKYVGCHIERTLASSLIIDTYILRKAFKRYVLPSKKEDAFGEMFEGATVLTPSKGLRKNVVVFDLKSLYPMSMMTLNASLETKDPNGTNTSPNGVKFKKEPDGLTRELISELLIQRDEKKKLRNTFPYGSREYDILDMQQNVLKIIMNTYYGVSGFPKFRLYDRDIGSAVTATGRAIIEHSKKIIEGMGHSVVYGDTDSTMVELKNCPDNTEEIIKMAKNIEVILNQSYDQFARDQLNVDKHYFSTKFEKLYKRFFQAGKKKRYAGHLVWKEGLDADEIDITGFETKRSDTPPIIKEVLKNVIKMILDGKREHEVQSYIRGIIKSYRKGEYSLENIGIPSGITKDFELYKNNDIRVRAAKYSNQNLGTSFTSGSKPRRIYIKDIRDKRYPPTNVIAFEFADQIPKCFVIDYELMLSKTLKDPLMRIIETLGWSWAEMDPTMTTLSQFCSSNQPKENTNIEFSSRM